MKKNKIKKIRFNSKVWKILPVFVVIILTFIISFLYHLFTTYKPIITIDNKGFMLNQTLSVDTLKNPKSKNVKKNVPVTFLEENDIIYQTPLNHYYNQTKKSTVDIDYPFFISDGLSIINYNDDTNLIDSELTRMPGLSNHIFSYGKAYNLVEYDPIDDYNYILMSYPNGVYINLYDLKVTTASGETIIPIHSFMYFKEDSINYYRRDSSNFSIQSILDIRKDSKLSFYFDSTSEHYTYPYESFLTSLGNYYQEEEIELPKTPIVELEDQIEEVVSVEPVVEEEEEFVPTENEEGTFVWIKPVVTSSILKGNVYSINGEISVSDPAKVITKAPTYTLFIKEKTYSRRSFYKTGNIVISGVLPSTTYTIVGQYTYLDEDLKTKKLVTFYSGEVTTLGMELLDPIDISYELGNIYPRKIEFSSIQITSDLKSESLRGVRNVGITVGKETYFLSVLYVSKLLGGQTIEDIATGESLKSNSRHDFEINFYDVSGNKMDVRNNKGYTYTSKKAPLALLKLKENEIDYVVIGIDLKNEDDIEFSNYRYSVMNSSGRVIKQGPISGSKVKIDDLDPNQILTIRVSADVDLEDGRGVQNDYELGTMEFTSLPIASLGFLNFNISLDEVTKNSISVSYSINSTKTDARLLKLLKELKIVITNQEYEEDQKIINVSDSDILSLKAYGTVRLYVNELDSNTKYSIIFSSVVQQGETRYDLDCLQNIDEFETHKIPAIVLVENSFVTNEMIDFDVKVVDEDHAILSDVVRVELRDISNKLISSKVIDINTDDFIRITYNYLKVNQNYVIYFIADEYNETNNNSTFISKYELLKLDKYTEEGISGKIELQSSLRMAKGDNLVDIESQTKWIQTVGYYTVPRKLDDDNVMHIYSKTSGSTYMYDLSDYRDEIVTATFKIKGVTTFNEKVYFCNYLGGTASQSYGIELDNISTRGWTTYSYTFRVGSYKSGNNYYRNYDLYYGKYRTDFVGFYINTGRTLLTEYLVKDFEIHIENDKKGIDLSQYSLEKGTYNSNGSYNNTATYIDNRIRLSAGLLVEPSNNYEFYFSDDRNYTAYIYFTDSNNKYVAAAGWFESGALINVPSNATKAYIQFRYYQGNLNLNPEDITLSINRCVSSNYQNQGYQAFDYDFVTRVKVTVFDLHNEIANDTYYIKVLDSNGKTLYKDGYTELVDVDRIVDAIKRVRLEEDHQYTVQLVIGVRDREYVLDSFEISTNSEVRGIENVNDWAFVQPYGNYIVLNDIDFTDFTLQAIGFGYRYFYGIIDFQGYKAILNSKSTSFQKIGRIEKSGVLKNIQLEVHLDNDINNNSIRGFVSANYGTIENIFITIYDERPNHFNDTYVNMLADVNNVSGVIRNFVIKLETKLNMYNEVGVLTRYNYGVVENGYVYGENGVFTNETTQSARVGSFITRYGGVKSSMRNIFVLSSLEFPNNYSYDKTGLIAYETYGELINSYTVGSVNNIDQAVGPLLGYLRATADFSNVYYMSEYLYTMPNQNKISALNLNDATFQKSVLKNGFNVDEMVKLGYYPQVNFTYSKMPKQDYIELPESDDESLIEVLAMTILEQTYDTAYVEMILDNPYGDQITGVTISNLSVKIDTQKYTDGKSVLVLYITDPLVYASKYNIRSISSRSYTGHSSVKLYDVGEKVFYIDFYREVHNVQDWISINNNLTQNFAIMEDLDFREYANYFINNFSGKIEGNHHTLKNINIVGNKSGLINQMNGTMQNLYFENIMKSNDTNYSGVIAYSNQYGKFINVHVKNVHFEAPSTRVNDTINMGALVGNATYSRFTNCSATDVHLVSNAHISDVQVGGLIGYSNGSVISNVYVQNVTIEVSDSKNTYGVGGLIGRESSNVASIVSSYVIGSVTSNGRYTGGLVGYGNGYIENSYAYVNIVSDMTNVGGIVGFTSYPAQIMNNLYLGNMTISNSEVVYGRIIGNPNPSNPTTEDNVALRTGLINGNVTDETDGETLVDFNQLLDPETYHVGAVHLGDGYDVSQVSDMILPKIYYLDTEELLPNQRDNKFPYEELILKEYVIDKHSEYADVVFYINNPNNYIIDDVIVEGMDVSIIKNVYADGISVVTTKLNPNKYYDFYLLKSFKYHKQDSSEVLETIKNVNLKMQFYKRLASYEDWQNVSKTDPENYVITNDIDFTGLSFNTEVVFNRLETVEENEYHTISGMNYVITTAGNKKAIISLIATAISNVHFKDISITSTQTTNNTHVNIIESVYGIMRRMIFENVTIDIPYKNRIAPVGAAYTSVISDIELKNVSVSGKNYTAGFLSYFENSNGKEIYNIQATGLHITGFGNYIGGIIGSLSTAQSEDKKLIRAFQVRDSEVTALDSQYVGGVFGSGSASDVLIENIHVVGKQHVGGAFGHGGTQYTYNVTVRDSQIEGSYQYIGGISGGEQRLYDSLVEYTTVMGTTAETDNVGGIVGRFESYNLSRNTIRYSTVINNGIHTGGIDGIHAGGTASANNCDHNTITGYNYVGGITGNLYSGTIDITRVTNSTIHAENEYSGGLVGHYNNSVNSNVYREGYVRNSMVLESDITSVKHAGGFIGKKNEKLYNPQNIYGLYYASTVITEDENTGGAATGDEFNSEVIGLARMGFYENAVVNNQLIKSFASHIEVPGNLITEYTTGFIDTSNGREYMNYNYPKASYTNFIKLETGHQYIIRAKHALDNTVDIFRVRFYDYEKKYIGDMGGGGTTWNYFGRYYSLSNLNEIKLSPIRDCYIKVQYLYDLGESEVIEVVSSNANNIWSAKVLNASQLRDRITWNRYINEENVDYYYYTFFNYDKNYWDFSVLNSVQENLTVHDYAENGHDGTARVSVLHNDGYFFDGTRDYVSVPNFTPGNELTISTRFTSFSTRGYQFIFSYRENGASKGVGLFVHGRTLYAMINGSNYSTNYTIPLYKEVNVSMTYENNKVLKFYVNGVLVYTHNTVNKTIITSDSAETFIANDCYYNGGNRYIGVIKDIAVFNRSLSEMEIQNNIDTATITNPNGINFYYKFTKSNYDTVGYYPKLRWITNDLTTDIPHQADVELPLIDSFGDSGQMGLAIYNSPLQKSQELNLSYHVYSSGINTVNIEFDEPSKDISFKYQYKNKESEEIPVTKKVYSIPYDYINDIEITVRSAFEEDKKIIHKEDLSKKIDIYNGNYYYILDDNLYANHVLLQEGIIHLYKNFALSKDGRLYHLDTKEYQEAYSEEGILSQEIALHRSVMDGTIVNTFYGYSEVINSDISTIKNNQILYKNNHLFVYDPSNDHYNDTLITNHYNGKEYQIVLGKDNELYTYKSNINYKGYFMNSNIVEINSDDSTDLPIMMIRYNNDRIVVFNYYNGEVLFELGEIKQISLFDFFSQSVRTNNMSKIESYNSSMELIEQLDQVNDEEVLNRLNSNKKNQTNQESSGVVDKNTTTNHSSISEKYVTSYNENTHQYEVYDVLDVLDAKDEDTITVDSKIKSDTFLYQYFRSNKNANDYFKDNRVIVFGLILLLILSNLGYLIIKFRRKERVTNE